MKIWQSIILVILLVTLPVLSACDLLGIGGESEQEKLYRQQLEAYQQQMAAYKKQQADYYKSLEKGLNEYFEAYQDYQKKTTEQQIQIAEGNAVTANQTQQ